VITAMQAKGPNAGSKGIALPSCLYRTIQGRTPILRHLTDPRLGRDCLGGLPIAAGDLVGTVQRRLGPVMTTQNEQEFREKHPMARTDQGASYVGSSRSSLSLQGFCMQHQVTEEAATKPYLKAAQSAS
jgi:hypothetical protein